MKRSVLLLLFIFIAACSNTTAYEVVPIKPLDKEQFHSIEIPETVIPSVPPKTPKPFVRPQPKQTAVAKKVTRQSTRHSATLVGKASWYCSNSIPICHHSYPPGSMVAAACGKLRAAMGSRWRGKVVTVRANGRSVNVKLVDWCGSKDKTIDLYYAPMRKLGGSGVLTVRISW